MKTISNLRKYKNLRNYEIITHSLFIILIFSIYLFSASFAKAETTTSTIDNVQTVTSAINTTTSTTVATTTFTTITTPSSTPTNTVSTTLTTTTTITTSTTSTIAITTTTATATLPTTSTAANTTSANSTTTIQSQTTSSTNPSTGGSPSTTSTPTNTTNTATTTSSTAPTTISSEQINQAVNKILNYLKSQQDQTGKIIDAGITDWLIMSFVAAGQNPVEIKKYGVSLFEYAKNYQFTDASDINICAAYPRHYLALYTAGLPQNDDLMQQLLDNIKTKCYKNNLFGQRGINDDLFGLIALLVADANPDENLIQDIIKTITNDQTTDGAFTWDGWPGADITGGAVNALKYARNKGINIDETIFTKAKNYLKTQQLDDGGWGYFSSDALTTSWAIMGISSLNESQTDWLKNNKNPWHTLTDTLNNNGYYEPSWAHGTTDWFATKHGVPALLGQSWPIEPRFSLEQSSGSSYNPDPLNKNTTSTAPTTTTAFTTSTLITTSTIATTTIATTTTASSTITIETSKESNLVVTELLDEKKEENKKINTPTFINSAEESIREKEIKEIQQNTVSATELLTKPEHQQNTRPALPFRSTAKKIAGVSGSSALAIGLYLGWKLIKNLV